jgi:hypothetical protein
MDKLLGMNNSTKLFDDEEHFWEKAARDSLVVFPHYSFAKLS